MSLRSLFFRRRLGQQASPLVQQCLDGTDHRRTGNQSVDDRSGCSDCGLPPRAHPVNALLMKVAFGSRGTRSFEAVIGGWVVADGVSGLVILLMPSRRSSRVVEVDVLADRGEGSRFAPGSAHLSLVIRRSSQYLRVSQPTVCRPQTTVDALRLDSDHNCFAYRSAGATAQPWVSQTMGRATHA